MDSQSAIPRPSLLKPPAQSSGDSAPRSARWWHRRACETRPGWCRRIRARYGCCAAPPPRRSRIPPYLTGAAAQLLHARAAVPGLPRISSPVRAVGSHGDLVGAYDPGVGVLQGHGRGFGPGQPYRQRQRPLAAAAGLVHARRAAGKGTRSRSSSCSAVGEVEAKISEGGDFKNNDLHPIHFDRGGNRPYYTRPMAPGLPDRVDCAHLADERGGAGTRLPAAVKCLACRICWRIRAGSVRARFAFAKVDAGRAGATVTVEATPQLVCQRCLQGFALCRRAAAARLNFRAARAAGAADSQREVVCDGGWLG